MGAGYHGGFGKTYGEYRKQAEINRPITKLSDVDYNANKIQNYLLNINHPQGGTKAKFMQDVLGYTVADSKIFHRNVVKAIINKIPTETIQTKYGIKHIYHTELIGNNGKMIRAKIVVVIQKDNDRITHKIITVYPDKKEK